MKEKELLSERLRNQQLSAPVLQKPEDLVSWMGAVQAQDYAMSKWAIGLRIKDGTDEMVEEAIGKGTIIRTHVLRPTWHQVSAKDVRWMLTLTAPQILKQMAYYDRQLGIEQKEILSSLKLLEKTLGGQQQLTRAELEVIFTKAKFNCDGMRFGHLLMHAELRSLICSGARKGKQITYALLDERVPESKSISKDESLAKLAGQYFQSHGPATAKDFIWWSGLTSADGKEAIKLISDRIDSMLIDEETFYYFKNENAPQTNKAIYLLPNYDEYTVAYNNREAIASKGIDTKISRGGNPLFYNVVLIEEKIYGTWKRVIKGKETIIATEILEKISVANKKELAKAEERFRQFING